MAQASAEKLEHIGSAEKESGLSATERAVGKNAAAFAKRKRNRAVCSEYQVMRGERVKVGESLTLARERGSDRKHEEERVDSTYSFFHLLIRKTII